MTTTTAITLRTPPATMRRAFYRVTRTLFTTRMHGTVDGALLLLHVTGRRTAVAPADLGRPSSHLRAGSPPRSGREGGSPGTPLPSITRSPRASTASTGTSRCRTRTGTRWAITGSTSSSRPRHRGGDLPVLPHTIRGSPDSRNVRLPCTSSVRHRTTSVSTGLPHCPHSGHRYRVCSSGSTPMISTFSGARSLRGQCSMYVLTTTACSVSSTSSHTDSANVPSPARRVPSPSGTGGYRATDRPLWTDAPQKSVTTQT